MMTTHIAKCDNLTPYERAEKLSEVLEKHAQEAYTGIHSAEAFSGDEEKGESSSVLMMVDGRTMVVTITVEEVLDTYAEGDDYKMAKANNWTKEMA
jgi:hypothetical protein